MAKDAMERDARHRAIKALKAERAAAAEVSTLSSSRCTANRSLSLSSQASPRAHARKDFTMGSRRQHDV